MKNLKELIQEKLKIGSNSKVHNSQEQEWEDFINNWIEEWANDDFEYLMALIDKFLVDNTFDNDDYEELSKYEDDDKFKKFLTDKFIKFKEDNEKQIQSLKKIDETILMKNLKEIISEKLKINSKTQIHNRNPEDWSILNAEDGDIVELNDNLLFIYKGLNKDLHVNNASPYAIVYHAYYLCDNRKELEVITYTGVGEINNKPERYKLASSEKCKEFYKALDKAGYKWDETKLEVVKK